MAMPRQACSAPRRRNRGVVILCCLQFALDAQCCLRGVAVEAAEASTQDKNSWVRDARNHAGLRRRSASTSPGSRVRSRSRWLRRLTWAIPSSLLSCVAWRNALFFFERHDALAATRSAGLREVKRCLHGAPYAWPHLVQPTPRTGRLLILLPKLLTTLCVTRRVRFSRTEQSETHMKKVARSCQAPAKLILSKALLVSFSLGLGHANLHAEPRLTVISQWSAGAEGAAMDAFGNLVKKEGVTWQHSPVSGFTTDMMNKLRADIIAGRPPAASQLKGPQIKAWSAIGATVNMNDVVAATDFAQNISPD